MKIVAIFGSPRKNGASARIAQGFLETAQELGAEIKTHYLNGIKFRGCQGCNACKEKSEICIQKDDLTEVLADLLETDVAVFATPVYYWDVSGQFKCFFDRTWSIVKPDYTTNPQPTRLPAGKKAVLITTQGDTEDKHGDVAERYHAFLSWYGYNVSVIRGTSCGMEKDTDVDGFIAKAKKLAEKMVG